ncbi:MAG: putative bifunctional diguanylate cyclase/phosphodiesterase [Pikeienuella sp.]
MANLSAATRIENEVGAAALCVGGLPALVPGVAALAAGLNTLRDAVLFVDEADRVVWASRALGELLGGVRGRGHGWPPLAVLLRELNGGVDVALPVSGEAVVLTGLAARRLRLRRGERVPGGLTLVVLEEWTEGRAAAEALDAAHALSNHLARHDPLTGLPNRPHFLANLSRALSDASGEARVAVCLLDVERFKHVNEAFGQVAGDFALCRLGETLRRELAPDQVAARVGGDGFAVLIPEIYDPNALESLVKRLHAAVTGPIRLDRSRWSPTVSIGAACSEPGKGAAGELMMHAEIALADVKANRRGGTGLFSPVLGKQFADRARISEELRRAVEVDEFEAFFQPQIALETEEIIGFETLVRWRHPSRGLLEPCYFLAIAEDVNLTRAIDTAMLGKALHGLVAMRAAGHRVPRVSVNFSAASLRDPGFVDMVQWAVDGQGLRAEEVVIELLETALAGGPEDPAARTVEQLARAGFPVELDDFGTGYNCLSNLARLNVHAVKIDRSLIQQVVAQRSSAAIVRAIVALAEQLGIAVLAEGIERPEETAALRAFGCRLGQGYAFGRPEPLTRVIDWLARRPAGRRAAS